MAAQTREQGRYLGGRPPHGYRLGDAGPHPNKAHAAWGRRAHRLEADPVTAPVVRRMFAQRLAGHSAARITRALNDAGIPCPSAADPARNPHRTGAGWTLRTVAAILGNPRYTGRQVWNRQRTDFDLVDPANTGLGHKQVQRWNLPEGWVISKRPAHPALVSEADVLLEDLVLHDGLEGHRATVGDIGRVHRLVVDQQSAGNRVQSVGGDDDLRLVSAAVRERDAGAPWNTLVVDAVGAGDHLDAEPPGLAQQEAIQVAAVHHHVGEAIALLHVGQVQVGQLIAFERVEHPHMLGHDTELDCLLEQAVVVEDARAVRRELQAGAHLAERSGLLVEPDADALAGQADGAGKAADAAADDNRVGPADLVAPSDLLGARVVARAPARRPVW